VKKRKKPNDFDERESALRNKIIVHGFIILAGLIFIEAFLKIFGVHWAMGHWNAFVYLMFASTVISVEFYHPRGVF